MSFIILTIPLLPIIAAIILLIAALLQRGKKLAFPLSIGVLIISLGLSIYASLNPLQIDLLWFEPISLSFKIDGLASIMQVTACLITIAVLTAAHDGLSKQNRARSFGFMLMLLAAALLASMTGSLLVLLISWEIMAIAIWQLSGFLWQNSQVANNGAKVFMLLRLGDMGLYVAVAVAFSVVGSFDIAAIAQTSGQDIHLITAGLVFSAVTKSAQLPFSIWLGRALNEKAHISGTLTGALLVVSGGYLLVRSFEILELAAWALPLLAWTGGLTAFIMALVALVQKDIRQILAASSASQKGFIIMAVGLGSMSAAVAFIVAHAAYKGLLFLGGSYFQIYSGSTQLSYLASDENELSNKKKTKSIGLILFSLAAFSLAGLPPLSGWIVKDDVLAEATQALYILGMLAGFITSLYAGRLFWIVYHSKINFPTLKISTNKNLTIWGMLLLSVMILAGSALLVPVVSESWETLIPGPKAPHPGIWQMSFIGLIAVAGLIISRKWHQQRQLEPFTVPYIPSAITTMLYNWLGMGKVLNGLVAAILSASRKFANFDVYVLDKTTESIAMFCVRTANKSAKDGENGIEGLVNGVTHLISKAGSAARIPQTGLLHNYYAQAVTVLCLFIIFILWFT